jgi:hypothetical protein
MLKCNRLKSYASRYDKTNESNFNYHEYKTVELRVICFLIHCTSHFCHIHHACSNIYESSAFSGTSKVPNGDVIPKTRLNMDDGSYWVMWPLLWRL